MQIIGESKFRKYSLAPKSFLNCKLKIANDIEVATKTFNLMHESAKKCKILK